MAPHVVGYFLHSPIDGFVVSFKISPSGMRVATAPGFKSAMVFTDLERASCAALLLGPHYSLVECTPDLVAF